LSIRLNSNQIFRNFSPSDDSDLHSSTSASIVRFFFRGHMILRFLFINFVCRFQVLTMKPTKLPHRLGTVCNCIKKLMPPYFHDLFQ
jgi:hypothetical protein